MHAKICTKCNVELPLEKFYQKPSGQRYAHCRECEKKRNTGWRRDNPEKYHSIQRRSKLRVTLVKLGISNDEYLTLLSEQNGLCAICGNPEPDRYRLSIDHCHDTGRVRGLLCRNCNNLLGWARDRTEILQAAIQYLKER